VTGRHPDSVTLSSTLGKVLEQLMAAQTRKFIDSCIEDSQFGFRLVMGTEECIVTVNKSIEKLKSSSRNTAVVALDIRSAFHYLLWGEVLEACISGRCMPLISEIEESANLSNTSLEAAHTTR